MAGEVTLLPDPIHRPGCYDLEIYCKWDNPAHGFKEFPHSVTQYQERWQAERHAQAKGWVLHQDGLSTCPKCAKALRMGKWRGKG